MNDNTSAFNALEYDEKVKKIPCYENIYKQVIDIVNMQFGKSLKSLEIGCGTGKWQRLLYQ